MTIYFDNAATTPLDPEVLETLNAANEKFFANPSSLHSLGRKAKKALTKARKTLAAKINSETEEVFFKSGATEANNFVFKSLDFDLIITSPSEHPCILEAAKASRKPIHWLNLDGEGFIDIKELEKLVVENRDKKILVSIMHGNKEIGTVQDLKAIGELKSRLNNFIFHSDCVQTLNKQDIDVKEFNLDAASFSAHKIHGPKGVGALYLNKALALEIDMKANALIIGGGQESNIRSGTENLPAIIAFAKALEIYSQSSKILELEEKIINELEKLPGFVLHGAKDFKKQRIPGNINFSLSKLDLDSESFVLQMDLNDIAISSGSACSSNKGADSEASILSSYVLRACRIDSEVAKKAIRVSISRQNTEAEADIFLNAIKELHSKFSSKAKA